MNYTTALTTDQLQKIAPAAFAGQPYHGQSNRYAFIPTFQVIEAMRDNGYVPVTASQSRARIADKEPFAKHMIRFRSIESLDQQAVVGDSVMEAILVNSHDGSSTYRLMAGLWRFVCSNGMAVADSLFETLVIRHTGEAVRKVVEGTRRIFTETPRVLETSREWSRIELSPAEQTAFAESAHMIRFPMQIGEDGQQFQPSRITPDMLLTARRHDDLGNDLWRTFNRVQENSTKGIRASSNRSRAHSRGVTSINDNLNLNQALWSLAEKMAELKAA